MVTQTRNESATEQAESEECCNECMSLIQIPKELVPDAEVQSIRKLLRASDMRRQSQDFWSMSLDFASNEHLAKCHSPGGFRRKCSFNVRLGVR